MILYNKMGAKVLTPFKPEKKINKTKQNKTKQDEINKQTNTKKLNLTKQSKHRRKKKVNPIKRKKSGVRPFN